MSESNTNTINKQQHNTNVNTFTSVEKKSHTRHHITDDDMMTSSHRDAIEMYSLDDLPRVTRLNNEEVRSIDSALLSAEEQDLIDTDTDTHSSYPPGRYNSAYLTPDDALGARRMSNARRISAVSAARRMSSVTNLTGGVGESRFDHTDRRFSVLPPGRPTTPSTIHRNVSAFGEITVMPVGSNEDEDLRIAVGEEMI